MLRKSEATRKILSEANVTKIDGKVSHRNAADAVFGSGCRGRKKNRGLSWENNTQRP